jgi:NMD protein affecting ribosome stability and mRNA decay
MKAKKKTTEVRRCSACGAPIKTTILRQCPRCIRERRGI